MGSEEAIKGLKIALWGLSFKPNTDDMREAPALTIIEELTRLGATITAYDPIAMNEAKRILGNKISYATNEMEAVKDADVLFIVTEWLDFRSPDFDELGNTMNQRIILDGRNIYDKNTIKEHNFTYLSIGQAPIYSLEASTLKK
jgi:UDPglucose 6-dehydrogenase